MSDDPRTRCEEKGGIWDSNDELCFVDKKKLVEYSDSYRTGSTSKVGITVSIAVTAIGALIYVYGVSIDLIDLPPNDVKMIALGVIAIGLAAVLTSGFSVMKRWWRQFSASMGD